MTTLIANHGLLAVFVLMTLAAVVPAASELTMIYGGAIASGTIGGQIALFGHRFHPGLHAVLAVALTALVANTLGACGGWLVGVYGGHPLLERYGRYAHITAARIARAERWFERYEGVAVPLGFALPLARSFVAIPAGILEVGFPRFVATAFLGIAVFVFATAGIGWGVGSSWHAASHDADYVELAVALIAVGGLALLVARSRRTLKMEARGSDSAR